MAALAAALATSVVPAFPVRAADVARAVSPPSQVLAVDAYWLSVTDLNRSLSFYRDVVGLSVVLSTATPTRQAVLRSLSATPGARIRSITLRDGNGGPALRLLEFDGVRRRALHPRSIDPGAVLLQVSVADLGRVLAAARREHTPIVTAGAAPLLLPDGRRTIVLADPDGFFVALSQGPHSPSPSVQSAPICMRYTVAAPGTMVSFYRQIFGLHLQTGGFVGAGAWSRLLDAPGAQWADTAGLRDVQFVAFRRVTRHTFSGRPQDPGTPALSLRITNLRAALRAIRAAGLRVLSSGGQPVPLPDGGVAVLFRDPAGVLVELVQP
jgi:catechol 2,3-dioxygenase-like lactoylglutathione lyase family enzyme